MTAKKDHGDVVSVLTHDHRDVEAMFAALRDDDGSDEHRKDLADQVVIELVRHSTAEEQYLYPAVREQVPGGGTLADAMLAEHAKAELLMKELEGLHPGDGRFEAVLLALAASVTAHLNEEEEQVFPRFIAACPADLLRELGDNVRSSKKDGPTRPHPSAPDTPPGNIASALALGPIDRLRNALTHRGIRR